MNLISCCTNPNFKLPFGLHCLTDHIGLHQVAVIFIVDSDHSFPNFHSCGLKLGNYEEWFFPNKLIFASLWKVYWS